MSELDDNKHNNCKPSDYFFGYCELNPHPSMAATGTEGRCELCGMLESSLHVKPYKKCPNKKP